jgi:hypothetical protein
LAGYVLHSNDERMLRTWTDKRIFPVLPWAIGNEMAPVGTVVFGERDSRRGLGYLATGEVASPDVTKRVSHEDVGRTNVLS